jgi:hypothetical protein
MDARLDVQRPGNVPETTLRRLVNVSGDKLKPVRQQGKKCANKCALDRLRSAGRQSQKFDRLSPRFRPALPEKCANLFVLGRLRSAASKP